MNANPDLIRASYPAGDQQRLVHEGGHAVAAVVRNVPFEWVQVRDLPPDSEDGGFSRGRIRFAEASVRAIDRLVVDLAGGESERLFFGYIEPGHDRTDIAHARELLAHVLGVPLTDPLIDDCLKHRRLDAADLVKQHRPAIVAVSSWLYRERFLTAAAVKQICAACAACASAER